MSVKLKSILLVSCLVCSSVANQVCVRLPQQIVTSPGYKNYATESSCDQEGEFVDFDELDDDTINVENLVPKWARIANQIAAQFFIWYNNFSKWWNTKSAVKAVKKNRYMTRF